MKEDDFDFDQLGEEDPSDSSDEEGLSSTVEWAVWHLTPEGWSRGSFKNEFEGSQDIPHPKDRLLSYLYKECLEDAFKTETSETFRCKGGEQKISECLKKYGSPPKKL